jgi:hypothetical protein
MTREQLFAAPKVVRRAEERLDRGKAAVSAARARATEIAQQISRPKLRPNAFSQTPPCEVGAAVKGWPAQDCQAVRGGDGHGAAHCNRGASMRMNLRVAIGAASALRALQLIDLRIYGSPGSSSIG